MMSPDRISAAIVKLARSGAYVAKERSGEWANGRTGGSATRRSGQPLSINCKPVNRLSSF
jgi:hypothetical protein